MEQRQWRTRRRGAHRGHPQGERGDAIPPWGIPWSIGVALFGAAAIAAVLARAS